jgi:threonyl-tRNA synthetase
MATRHRPSRFYFTRAIRFEISRRRRCRPSARDDSPCAGRFDGAFLRRPHRTLRRQFPGFRITVDESNEKLGYKIRHWKTQKVPYILVVGKTEAADGTVNVNERGSDAKRTVSIDAFAEELRDVVAARR